MSFSGEIDPTEFVLENDMGKFMAQAAAPPGFCMRRVDN